MPQLRQAQKRLRQNRKRALRNRATRSQLRTLEKRVRDAVAAGDLEEAQVQLRLCSAAWDSAARKGRTTKNGAARKKSRLAKLVNAMSSSQEV